MKYMISAWVLAEAVGGVLGYYMGPLGIVVGAAFGAWISLDAIHKEETRVR